MWTALFIAISAASAIDVSAPTPTSPGHTAQFAVEDADPGSEVRLAASITGEGPGPCAPTLCLDLVDLTWLTAPTTTDDTGAVVLVVDLPSGLPLGPMWLQAVQVTAPAAKSAVLEVALSYGVQGGMSIQEWAAAAVDTSGAYLRDGPVPVGDLDGDGQIELAVQGGWSDSDPGTVYLATVPTSGLMDLTAEALTIIAGENDYDGHGASLSGGIDATGDGMPELAVGSWRGRYIVPTDRFGISYTWFGGPPPGELSATEADLIVHGLEDFDLTGEDTLLVPDTNGDGIGELVLTGPNIDGPAIDTGRAWMIAGPLPAGEYAIDEIATTVIRGDSIFDRAGSGVAAEDLDGDGLADLLVGAPGQTVVEAAGSVFAFQAPLGSDLALVDADGGVYGSEFEHELGTLITPVGDLDGDGLAEIALGDPNSGGSCPDLLGEERGQVHLVSNLIGGFWFDTAFPVVRGEDRCDNAGGSVAGGDVDGDGQGDLWVGSEDDTRGPDAGAVFLVYGPILGNVELSDADAKVLTPRSWDGELSQVANAGDVDGDGFDDALLGSIGGDIFLLTGGPGW